MIETSKPSSNDVVVSRLWTALQAVADPRTYVGTGEHLLDRHRAALTERAKAMTGLMLFMLEGLVAARVRFRERGICHVPSMVHEAWLRYLQLHGRQAEIIVPMDDWLVSALPRDLLTKDEQVLGVLANSVALGDGRQADAALLLPAELLLPAQLFGELIEDADLPSEIACLLSRQQPMPSRARPHLASLSAELTDIARPLVSDVTIAISAAASPPHSFDMENRLASHRSSSRRRCDFGHRHHRASRRG